tara:strand:- start:16316 stop:16609 length:294 start_codon:yes stop_codon:yes gene_type:complete
MRLKLQDVRDVAALARLKMTGSELELMREQLSDILTNFDALSSVNTNDIEPTGHSADVDSVMRDDESKESLRLEEVLENVPSKHGNFVRVRSVLGDQ